VRALTRRLPGGLQPAPGPLGERIHAHRQHLAMPGSHRAQQPVDDKTFVNPVHQGRRVPFPAIDPPPLRPGVGRLPVGQDRPGCGERVVDGLGAADGQLRGV
jgi:hypothetical protein